MPFTEGDLLSVNGIGEGWILRIQPDPPNPSNRDMRVQLRNGSVIYAFESQCTFIESPVYPSIGAQLSQGVVVGHQGAFTNVRFKLPIKRYGGVVKYWQRQLSPKEIF